MAKQFCSWCCLWIVLGVLGWSATARASLTSSADPVAVGNVAVNGNKTVTATVSSSIASPGGDALDHFTITGSGCGALTVAPTSPDVFRTIDSGTPMTIDVTFAPTVRGGITCTVGFEDAGNGSLGTPFTVTATGIAPVINPPATVPFGPVRVSTAAVQTVTMNIQIGNIGDDTLTISDISISGTNAGDFTFVTPPSTPVDVAANNHITVGVIFNPSAAGARAAKLDIASNDPITPSAHVDLTGTGTVATIAVTDISYGVVNLGASKSLSTAVTNTEPTNPGPLTVIGATITDDGGGAFTLDPNGFSCTGTSCVFTGGVLAPTSISVKCTPPAGSSGTITGTMTVASDADGGDSSVGLSCEVGRADATVDPASINFGAAVVVGSTVQQIVTVDNVGNNIDLTYTVTKSGTRAGEYTLSGCITACVVAAGTNKTFTLSFTPTAIGAANINLTLASNDPDGNITIPVTASSVAPQMTAPATLQFNNVEVDTSSTKTLTITNSGGATMSISSADFGTNDGSYALVTGTTGAQTVAAGASANWDIKCTPTTQGAHNGTFVIASDAFGAATTTVQLRCTGTEGILVVATNPVTAPPKIDFGGVAENTVATKSFTLTNSGNLTVSNITATITAAATFYTISAGTPVPSSLTAGQQVTIDVKFAPLSDTDGGPASITFAGTWGTGAKPLRAPPVLLLDGDGLTTGFATSPDTIDFGDLRFDRTATQTFCILNTGAANITVSTITIAPDPGTASNEFTVPIVTGKVQVRQKQCGSGGAGTALLLPVTVPPQSTTPGQQLEVTVTADPNNRTGAMDATLTVTTTLPTNNTRTVALTANSTSAMLTLDPGNLVDFGTVDIQTGPVTKVVTITNTGDGPLDLGSFVREDGGANTHFTFTLPGDTTLAPGNALPISVTYTPTVVTMPTEEVVIDHTIAGDINAPSAATITLRGKAIDREIDITATTTFPDTFRNPGADAPVRPVTVTNTGEATLHITAAMVTSADPAVWTLVDATPQDVPGGASFDFLVRFAPTSVGTQPTGTLTLTSDDSSEPMAEVTFSGNGIDRNVAFGAPRVDLGFTGVGVPVTLDDVLLVASMNASTTFRITRIDVADADPACIDSGMISDATAFAVIDPPNGDELPASEQRTFGMAFAANVPGRFVASAQLFIDSDPIPQATICVQGTAVFVDAHGGGGCSSGRGLGGGALILIGFAALGLRRRRASAAAVLVVFVLASPARADKLVISIFDPTPSTTGISFQEQTAEVGADGTWAITAAVSNATDPLVLDAAAEGQARVIERSTMLVLGGAYAFGDRFEAGAHMPFYLQDGAPAGDRLMMFTADPANGAAAGDLTMHGKARLWKRGGAALGAALQLTLPTAARDSFTGTEKPSLRALGLATLVPDALEHRLTLSGHLGAVARAKSRFANIEQGSGGTWGIAASVRALDNVWFAAEVFGDVLPSARKATATSSAVSLSPIEWLAGLRWMPDHRFGVGLAMGRGLTSAAGSPSLRAVLELSYSPAAPDLPPIRIAPTPKPDVDTDGDGIPDSADRCPNEPEDKDMFEDTDGCPDLDNDHDGVPDAADKCPLDAEDKDGFEDADGCPDKDNDGDGIPDATDKCPDLPEDKDGHDDLDGCPDLDDDKDGIPDSRDKCPEEPETINGIADDDGCPDRGDSAIVLSPDRIETLDAVVFERSKPAVIAKSSGNLLGQVGATIRAHAEIVRVRVTCYVNPTGNYDKDQELSDKRAQAVRDWLIQWGIDGKRVEARGFGGTKPLAPANSPGAQKINDRIEFIILERK